MTNALDGAERADHGRNRNRLTSSGILSRDLTRAVVRTGVNAKTLKRWEKNLRSILKPRGSLAELMFDRCWSCYLRLYLIARLEAKLLTSDTATLKSNSFPILRESIRPILILNPNEAGDDDANREAETISQELIRALSLTARYDTHYSREFKGLIATLISMRDAAAAALDSGGEQPSHIAGKDDQTGSS